MALVLVRDRTGKEVNYSSKMFMKLELFTLIAEHEWYFIEMGRNTLSKGLQSTFRLLDEDLFPIFE